jgi:hypothetical protein
MKYSFETDFGDGLWKLSKQRFEDLGDAADEMADWARICLENGKAVPVRLAVIEEEVMAAKHLLIFGGHYLEDGDTWTGESEGLEFEFNEDGSLGVVMGERGYAYTRELTPEETVKLTEWLNAQRQNPNTT